MRNEPRRSSQGPVPSAQILDDPPRIAREQLCDAEIARCSTEQLVLALVQDSLGGFVRELQLSPFVERQHDHFELGQHLAE